MDKRRESGLSLRVRFALGMGVMLVPLLLAAVSTVVVFERMLAAIHDAVEEASEELQVLGRLQVLLARANVSLQECLLEGRTAVECPAFSNSRRTVDTAFERAWSAPFGLAEERTLLAAAREQWRRAGDLGASVLEAPEVSGGGFATEFVELDTHLGRAAGLLEQAHRLSEGEMASSIISARSRRGGVLLLVGGLLVLGLFVATAGATTLARGVLTPISALERGAAHFAEGDLSYRVEAARPPEFHRLANTFNRMADALRKKERALADLSARDALTNVFNRRELLRRLTVEIERSRRYGDPFALLFLDADGLKKINDTDGHQVGDAVLSRFACLIERAVRPTDVVGRYGGDEFAVVVPRTSRAGGLVVAERIRDVLATEWTNGAPRWSPPVTTSIGLAVFPDDGAEQDALIRAADGAVYDAKSAGGDCARAAGPA